MRVSVTIHETAREQFEDWLRGEEDDTNRGRLNRIYAEELIRILAETAGEVPQAVCVRDDEPKVYWWRYSDEMTVTFMVKKERMLALGRVRRIIITGFRRETDPRADE
jgi:hypothetical protein